MKQCRPAIQNDDSTAGMVFQIQRWSVHDGDGIRSTVFLKGCPLRCKWCANPESWNSNAEILFFAEKCHGCGRCIQSCPADTTVLEAKTCTYQRSKCQACLSCCGACPTGARQQAGTMLTVAEIMDVICRDAVFYRESGGGVTFSGGEAFAQPRFLRRLVTACQRQGFDTAVETCGYFDWEEVQDIIASLDCIFVDIKHMDSKIHKEMTGVANTNILENIKNIAQAQARMIIRIPLITGVNDSLLNIRQMCEFLLAYANKAAVEILPYHAYGKAKWGALGLAGQDFITPAADQIAAIEKFIAGYGLRVESFK